MIRTRTLVLLALATALAGTACGRYVSSDAAVVNGIEISMDDLDREVDEAAASDPELRQRLASGDRSARTEVRRQALAELIRRAIVASELARRDASVTDADVDKRFAEVRDSFPSPAEFEAALRAQQLDERTLKQRIRADLPLERLREVAVPVTVTPAEIEATYRSRISQFEQARVRHILFSTQNSTEAEARRKAEGALQRIRGGVDFAALAREISDDTGSRAAGGDLGFQPRGRFIEAFDRAAFTLPIGRVSEPVRTEVGFHLIEVLARRTVPLAEVRESIRREVARAKSEEGFGRLLDEVLAGARIEVNPSIGDIDPKTLRITDHRSFEPPLNERAPAVGLPQG